MANERQVDIIAGQGVPSGSFAEGTIQLNQTTGVLYRRTGNTWKTLNGSTATSFNILDFGAVADATGVENVGTDSTSAIQSALDAAGAVGGEVIIPGGSFRTTAPLLQSHRTIIRGQGAKSIIYGQHAGAILKHVGAINGSTAGYGVVENLTFQGISQTYLNITAASNANPIEITTAVNHNLNTNDFIEISGVLGNTAANGHWKIIKTSATKFTLVGSVGNGVYTSGGTISLRPLIGIHDLACSFDSYDGIEINNCIFGLVFDQSEVCYLQRSAFAGNIWAQIYLTNGSDITPTASPNFTNSVSIKDCQINGGKYGIVDDGGVIHSYRSCNLNGQSIASIRLTGLTIGSFEQLEIESAETLLTLGTFIKGDAVGQCGLLAFRECIWSNNGHALDISSCGTLAINSCEMSTASTHIIGGANAFQINIGQLISTGTVFDTLPTTFRYGADGGPLNCQVSSGSSAPGAGTWNAGAVVWNTAPTAGGNIGWVCTTGGTPGVWKTFGAIQA